MENQISDSRISLSDLLREITNYSKQSEKLLYEPNAPKSAVTLIIRKGNPNPQNLNSANPHRNLFSDQILFLRRKITPTDRFSGQLCFPGGKQQPNETLLEAAMRQALEQTGFELSLKNLLGCWNEHINFVINRSVDKSFDSQARNNLMHVYIFVFAVSFDECGNDSIEVNPDEMASHQWVPAHQIFNLENLAWFDYSKKIKKLLEVYSYRQQIKENLSELKLLKRSLAPAVNVKVGVNLYGITYNMLNLLMLQTVPILKRYSEKSKSQTEADWFRIAAQVVEEVANHGRIEDVHFEVGQQPLNGKFFQMEKALLHEMNKMRPKM